MSSSFPAASAVINSLKSFTCFCTSSGESLACFLKIGNRNRLASDRDLLLLALAGVPGVEAEGADLLSEFPADRRNADGGVEAEVVEWIDRAERAEIGVAFIEAVLGPRN